MMSGKEGQILDGSPAEIYTSPTPFALPKSDQLKFNWLWAKFELDAASGFPCCAKACPTMSTLNNHLRSDPILASMVY